uniref:Eukaryotic translation initiation factor 3 subunit A n=1 Tax=Rhabditophanes sp. KR3021 TaxID=114890 RepID=A0AC35TNF1_9BILA
MGIGQFQKPETALQRAQEFISVGKERDALDTLHEVMKDRRQKQWTATIEQIMLKHVELCVKLRNSSYAKDALFHYKGLSQQTSIGSFETVLKKFLDTAEKETEAAQKFSNERVEEIEDLEQADTPESMLLSVVSGAVAQDRRDRAILSPWLRFLWDSYRNCLDMLRNNQSFEQLYHEVARKSFGFCARYQRRTEFRKLCETLRLHLMLILKSQAQSNVYIKLTNVESLQMMQETRSIQLDTAIKMELWQEAYKSAEDLHGMMQLSKEVDKKMVKPVSYANYYDKLSLIFWKGGNTLFHATALLQKFASKDVKKNLNAEDQADQANKVLLAVMSIGNDADKPGMLSRLLDFTEQFHTNIRTLSALLRLSVSPTRAALVNEVTRMNIAQFASETVRTLYTQMEYEFSPLTLATIVTKSIEDIKGLGKPEYLQYQESINHVAATKVFKQISLLYDAIKLDKLRAYIPFYSGLQLERFIVDICKQRFLRARIDHRSQCITFIRNDESLCGDHDVVDHAFYNGGTAKDNEVNVHNVLGHLYSEIRNCWLEVADEQRKKESNDVYKTQLKSYLNCRDRIQKEILKRRETIENYKENTELAKQEKAIKQAEALKTKRERETAEELRRLKQANLESAAKRKELMEKEILEKIRVEKLNQIKSQPMYQQIIKEKGEEAFANLDPQDVINEHTLRAQNEARSVQLKQKNQEKRFDHLIRATHQLEVPFLNTMSRQFDVEGAALFDEVEKKRIAKEIADHEKEVKAYELFSNAAEDLNEYCSKVKESHKDEFVNDIAKWEKEFEALKKKITNERYQKRVAERKRLEQERMEDEARRKVEEDRRILEDERRTRAAPFGKKEAPPSEADNVSSWRNKGGPAVQTSYPTPHQASSFKRDSDTDSYRKENNPIRADGGEGDSKTWKRGNPIQINSQLLPPQREAPQSEADNADSWRKKDAPAQTSISVDKKPSAVIERRSGAVSKPREDGPTKPSPFGNQKPREDGPAKPSPFGNQKPREDGPAKPSPFGNQKPREDGPAKPSPFGNQKPREDGPAKPSPFGNQRPREDNPPRSNDFSKNQGDGSRSNVYGTQRTQRDGQMRSNQHGGQREQRDNRDHRDHRDNRDQRGPPQRSTAPSNMSGADSSETWRSTKTSAPADSSNQSDGWNIPKNAVKK